MIHELKAQDFKLARHVYEGLSYNLVIYSVIEKNTNGRVYSDDPRNPRTSLLWNCQDALLLEGSPYNNNFNLELAEVIRKQIIPDAASKRIPVLSLHYFPDQWHKAIENTILQYLHPEKSHRNLYWFRSLRVDWRREIPAGIHMQRIDSSLLEQRQLKNYQDMCAWIDSYWHTQGDFLKKGVGYCLLKGDTILSWAVSVYVGGQNCELGLATIPPYRNRGYATLTAAACVEYCVENKIVPHWHCDKNNTPSITVAEKVGFEKVMEYPVYRFQTLLSEAGM
jgi:RimJ/RimL family protein N-acetyltransferase